MIKKILDVFAEMNYSTVYMTKESAHIFDIKNAETVSDSRCGIFMAYGVQRMKCNGAVLIIGENEIGHCYTGLTEAWFQNEPVVVIEVSSRKNSYPFLERCTDGQYFINNDNYRTIIADAMKRHIKPIVFSYITELNVKKEPVIPDKVLNGLLSGPFSKVIIAGFRTKVRENIICRKDLYGAVSMYFGYVQTNERQVLFVAPAEVLDYERNILYSRYLNDQVRMILFGNIRPELESLLRGCGILYYSTDFKDALQKITEASGAVICVVGEEELCIHR